MGKSCCHFSLKNILGILIFPPLGSIRRKPEHMEGDETCILYNFYDDTAKHSDSVF